MKQYDYVIVGAGIVGLATAYRLLKAVRQARVLVVDKEDRPGFHQTGHNSGVIHSGIYYRPGSAKANNCIKGYRMMIDFLEKHGIPYRLRGKLIVATTPPEEEELERLYQNGLTNGLKRIQKLTAKGIKQYEPHIKGNEAILVPYTGITDYAQVASALAFSVRELGGEILLNTKVKHIEPGQNPAIHTNKGIIKAGQVVVGAGLQTDRLWGDNEFRIIPFRGEYYFLRPPKDQWVKTMIYPVPDPRYPFLGVHLTRHIDGKVSAGPSAILSAGRETYEKFAVDWDDLKDTLNFPGFWPMAKQNYRAGLAEMMRWISKSAFLHSVRKFLPELKLSDLTGYHAGIRAQLVDREGRLVDDFVFRQQENVLFVLNAPSPAATASLSIGEHIVHKYLIGREQFA